MKKKQSPFKNLFINFNRLVPFIGFLFVITGIMGLVFIQKPLGQSQELRSDASEAEEQVAWPTITAKNPNQDFYVNQDSQISLNLDTSTIKVIRVNTLFNIINDSIETPTVTVNLGSGLQAEKVEIQKVDDGYLVEVVAVPNNINWLVAPTDTSFLKINFLPTQSGIISINFDEDNTNIQSQSLAYQINTEIFSFDIIGEEDEEIICTADVFQCSDGSYVSRTGDNCEFSECPRLKTCNEVCESNSNCEVGYRCFNTGDQNRCRLATNSSSNTCQPASEEETADITYRQCNQTCSSSNDCQAGLTCWDGSCRNPNNTTNTSCANLTVVEQTNSVNSCGESCSSNADCAINLRCYNSECRLVTNPSSLTCSPAETQTISNIYDKDSTTTTTPKGGSNSDSYKVDSDTNDETSDGSSRKDGTNQGESNPSQEVIKENDNSNGIAKSDYEESEHNSILDEDVPVNETAFDLIVKMLKNKQQSLPTSIILIGIALLAASLLILLVARLLSSKSKNHKYKESNNTRINIDSHKVKPGISPATTPISTQNTRVKELMNKLNDKTNSQNQG